MPYIPAAQRQALDPFIDELAVTLVSQAQAQGYDGALAGLLNYTITRLALSVVRRQFGPLRYWLIALVSGTLKNVADEFYRRLAVPYEEQQRVKSGDVDLYQKYLAEINQGP
jgi:uncharacterized membrane-anchored protein